MRDSSRKVIAVDDLKLNQDVGMFVGDVVIALMEIEE